MNAHTDFEADALPIDGNKVLAFPSRARAAKPAQVEREPAGINMERFPVDIRGQVTFGRLMSGLATVGLTVRVDTRSGRVVITDDAWEQ